MRYWRCAAVWAGLTVLATVEAGTLARFRTVYGDLEVELHDSFKPLTVNNFKRLVNAGAYQNCFIHRVEPGFVAQGGGFAILDPSSQTVFGPPWSADLFEVPHYGPISNEFGFGPWLSNTNGTLAMAKLNGAPDSATCQWFFNLGDNSSNLDYQNGGFTVFGRVVRDYGGVLPALNGRGLADGLQYMGWHYPNDFLATNVFTMLPVTYSGPFAPYCSDLVYVTISLLSLEISRTNNLPLLSWESLPGVSNVLEYAEAVSPTWSTLLSTNGTGGRIGVIDHGYPGSKRLYRLRIAY